MDDNKYELFPEYEELPASPELDDELERDFKFIAEHWNEPQVIETARWALLHHFEEKAIVEHKRRPYFELAEKIEAAGKGKDSVPVFFSFSRKDTINNLERDGLKAVVQVHPRNIQFRSIVETRENVAVSPLTDRRGRVEFRTLTLGGHTYETEYMVVQDELGQTPREGSQLFELPLSRSRKLIEIPGTASKYFMDKIIFNASWDRMAGNNASVLVGWEEISKTIYKEVNEMPLVPMQTAIKRLDQIFEKAGLKDEMKEEAPLLARLLRTGNWYRTQT